MNATFFSSDEGQFSMKSIKTDWLLYVFWP